MKKSLKSLLTLCVFGFSFMTSVFSAEAIEQISSDITETEIQINETEILTDDTLIYSEYLPDFRYTSNESGFLYYDQLDSNNTSAYNAMKVWLEPTTEEFTVSLPETLTYQTASTDMSSWSEEQYNDFWNMVFSSITYGKDALTFDYPELFWLDLNQIKITLSNVKISRNFLTSKYTMKISELKLQGAVREEYTDVATAKEYKQLIEDSVNNFEIQGSDRYQQVKYIHDYIAKTVSYNADAPYCNAVTGLFCEPYEIVCEGYSKAFKLLCDKADIPCIVVPGNIDYESNTGHMWNYVMMEDNEWYGLDCTWDDDTVLKYKYFLKGSDSFGTNHTPDTEYYTTEFVYPELNTADYVYQQSAPVTTVTTAPLTTTVTTTTTVKQTTTEPAVTTIPQTTAVTASTKPLVTSVSTTVTSTETAPVTTTATPEHITGDYNLDGKIDVADLVMLRKAIICIIPMDENFPNDDLNNDSIINVLDYVILSRIIIGGA